MKHTNHRFIPSTDPRYEVCSWTSCSAARRAVVTTLDHKEAKERRDSAVTAVAEHSEVSWVFRAKALGRQIATEMGEFTSDEFWRRGLPKPAEPRALGPVLTALERDGVIEATDRFIRSAQVLRHTAPIRVWRSRVARG